MGSRRRRASGEATQTRFNVGLLLTHDSEVAMVSQRRPRHRRCLQGRERRFRRSSQVPPLLLQECTNGRRAIGADGKRRWGVELLQGAQRLVHQVHAPARGHQLGEIEMCHGSCRRRPTLRLEGLAIGLEGIVQASAVLEAPRPKLECLGKTNVIRILADRALDPREGNGQEFGFPGLPEVNRLEIEILGLGIDVVAHGYLGTTSYAAGEPIPVRGHPSGGGLVAFLVATVGDGAFPPA